MKKKDFLIKCAWCDAININSVWLPKTLERFVIKAWPNALISHGICNKCLKNHFLLAYHETALHRGGPRGHRRTGL